MTSLALVARPRLPVDHLEYASLININCRYGEFLNTGLGGRVRKVVLLRMQWSVSGQELWKLIIQATDRRDINEEY